MVRLTLRILTLRLLILTHTDIPLIHILRLTDTVRNMTISSHRSGRSLTQLTPSTGQNCDPGQEAEG